MSKSSTKIKKTDFETKETVLTTTKWGRDDENTPVYAVVSAVAEVEGSDPVDLPPLYNVINPEALNELFTSRPEPAVETVTFEYTGYDVVVRGSGEVQIRSA